MRGALSGSRCSVRAWKGPPCDASSRPQAPLTFASQLSQEAFLAGFLQSLSVRLDIWSVPLGSLLSSRVRLRSLPSPRGVCPCCVPWEWGVGVGPAAAGLDLQALGLLSFVSLEAGLRGLHGPTWQLEHLGTHSQTDRPRMASDSIALSLLPSGASAGMKGLPFPALPLSQLMDPFVSLWAPVRRHHVQIVPGLPFRLAPESSNVTPSLCEDFLATPGGPSPSCPSPVLGLAVSPGSPCSVCWSAVVG